MAKHDFTDRATRPERGPADILRWKLGAKEPRRADFDAVDAVRPGTRAGGAAALATGEPTAVWIGHATWALRLGGKLIVTDPMWSTAMGTVRRLVAPGVALADMPKIDVVLISHDHRDHMDLPTLQRLPDDALYACGLGNGERLARIGKRHVVELDWWQTHEHDGLSITFVPARHWSMRMPWNRNATLWGGFVVRSRDGTAYHAGDTSFGDHFAAIGAKLDGIDWAMIPIGAYAPRWFMEPQHIDPDEAGRAFVAVGARNLLAMHWGTFKMTDEAIGEPPERLRAWWGSNGLAEERMWICDVGEPRRLTR
jgi:L-ascorbate metabolism protein UlaG (beta-lactamase superfamily)